jgi:hypothetical protein
MRQRPHRGLDLALARAGRRGDGVRGRQGMRARDRSAQPELVAQRQVQGTA